MFILALLSLMLYGTSLRQQIPAAHGSGPPATGDATPMAPKGQMPRDLGSRLASES